jgi:hypothetical protein
LVHGGILAALVDEGCAEYSNRGALTLYPLTKYLGVEFKKPSPTGGVFIAKVFHVSTISTYHQRVEKGVGGV